MPVAFLALVAAALVHLGAQVAAPDGVVADLTQILLMPALLWVLLTGTPSPKSRLVQLVAGALALSWLGDTLPRFADDGSDTAFGLMLGCFLLAQLVYVTAFLPFASESIARRKPALLLPYVIALAILIAVTGGDSGALFPAVVLYGVVITAMAILATGIDRVATIGAILFLISDALIALDAFLTVHLPLQGFWVMLTYVLGQTLIVLAVANHDRSEASVRTAPAPASRP